jgi:hypothetical protein
VLVCGLALPAASSFATFVPQAEIPGYGGTGFGQGSGDVSLSGDGNTALVADSNQLGAWTFTRSGSAWREQAAFHSSGGHQEGWGNSTALSGDGNTAMVGSGVNGWPGRATVFSRSGAIWTEQTVLGATSSGGGEGSGFGWSVAVSGDGNTALVGSPFQGPERQEGAAWVFTRSEGRWSQPAVAVLRGAGEISAAASSFTQAQFGAHVALSADGRIALVGAAGDNESRGAAWVFERSGPQWIERGKLTTSDEFGSQRFGNSVALSANGNVALIGGAGAAWVFERAGDAWLQRGPRLRTAEDPETAEGHFGWTVAMSADGNTAVTGAHGVGEKFGGAAWVLRRSGTSWTQQRLSDPNGERTRGINFGYNVAISGDGTTLLISAPGEWTGTPAGGGAAWVFVGPPWSPNEGLPSGGPVATGTAALVLTGMSQSHSRWRERLRGTTTSHRASVPLGTTFSFSLNQPARVRFAFTQVLGGRKAGRRCDLGKKRGRRCELLIARGALVLAAHAGMNAVRFSGSLRRGRSLPPGTYRMAVIATNAAGQRTPPATLAFTIVR